MSAEPGDDQFRTSDSDLIWKTNLEGTSQLIDVVQQSAPSARFIMASTSNVYDRASSHPAREDDPVQPQQAYPASKVAAEGALRESSLTWTILRFPFVYGDGDGHLEMLPRHLSAFGFHPAHRMSTIHHRDIGEAMKLALVGVFDGRTVNLSDDAPTAIYDLVRLVGAEMASSAHPVSNPWYLYVDASLARSLGVRATVRTVRQAVDEGIILGA